MPMHAGVIKPEEVWTPSGDVLKTLRRSRPNIHRALAGTSVRTGYDGINAANIPSGAPIAGGYADGLYIWSAADWARFGGLRVPIVVNPTHDLGTVYDCEVGNGTPADAVPWVVMRREAGVDPTVYCGQSSWWAAIIAAFNSAGVAQPHYWVASYDQVPSIPPGAVAKQYADPGPYDLSAVVPFWPGVDSGPAPLPVPLAPQEDDMPYILTGPSGEPALYVDGPMVVGLDAMIDETAYVDKGFQVVGPVDAELYNGILAAGAVQGQILTALQGLAKAVAALQTTAGTSLSAAQQAELDAIKADADDVRGHVDKDLT